MIRTIFIAPSVLYQFAVSPLLGRAASTTECSEYTMEAIRTTRLQGMPWFCASCAATFSTAASTRAARHR